MKFSIIIPVYNVEKYLDKCLKSVENQTFNDFEAILVNDGSTDNSQKIIDAYVRKNPKIFKSFIKENGGASDARNYAIERATGEYLVFLDSDDYFDIDYLEKINDKIKKHKDFEMIRISTKIIQEKDNIICEERIEEKEYSGEELFICLRNKRICIETPWSYVIKREYWKKNNFKFPKGKLQEDFAIMLVVLLKANKVYQIEDVYYNYLIRENSAMTTKSYEVYLKRAKDKLEHYDNILNELLNMNNISNKAKKGCLEYVSTAVCMDLMNLNKNDKKEHKKQLIKRKVLKNFKCDTLKSTIKKLLFFIMIYI